MVVASMLKIQWIVCESDNDYSFNIQIVASISLPAAWMTQSLYLSFNAFFSWFITKGLDLDWFPFQDKSMKDKMFSCRTFIKKTSECIQRTVDFQRSLKFLDIFDIRNQKCGNSMIVKFSKNIGYIKIKWNEIK